MWQSAVCYIGSGRGDVRRRKADIANTLRGKMNADEFRDYILVFIFFKYLSEKMHTYANTLLQEDVTGYADIDEPCGYVHQSHNQSLWHWAVQHA